MTYALIYDSPDDIHEDLRLFGDSGFTTDFDPDIPTESEMVRRWDMAWFSKTGYDEPEDGDFVSWGDVEATNITDRLIAMLKSQEK